jgi:formate/nitrite transporter FocA (FNT family)
MVIVMIAIGRDHIVVGFTTTHAISAYYHERCEFESFLWRAVLDTALCDKICQ